MDLGCSISPGLYEDYVARGALTSSIVLHALNGRILGEMDILRWSERQTGYGYLRIRRLDFMDLLLGAAKKQQIPFHFGRTLTCIEERDDQVFV